MDGNRFASIGHNRHLKAQLQRIQCGIQHAIIGREPGDKELVDFVFFQEIGKSGGAVALMIEKSAVAIHLRVYSLIKSSDNFFLMQEGADLCAIAVLDAMIWPQ